MTDTHPGRILAIGLLLAGITCLAGRQASAQVRVTAGNIDFLANSFGNKSNADGGDSQQLGEHH